MASTTALPRHPGGTTTGKDVTVYAVNSHECKEYRAVIDGNAATGGYGFRDVKAADERINNITLSRMIENDLNSLCHEHQLYELDSSNSNHPDGTTMYYAADTEPNVLVVLNLDSTNLNILGESSDDYRDLHISPIGKSLYLRIDTLVDGGGYTKVRHLIMESYDGFYSRVPIPAVKHTAGVGYGTSNLHTWGEAKHGAK
ncbi:hypothetical protein FOZ63_024628, partial [Perkinsus olseni]